MHKSEAQCLVHNHLKQMLGGHKESTAINLINKTVRFWSVNSWNKNVLCPECSSQTSAYTKGVLCNWFAPWWPETRSNHVAWRPNQPNGLHAPSCIWWFVPWQSLAGWFGFEHTRLLPEWIDTLAGNNSSLLLQLHVVDAIELKLTILLQLGNGQVHVIAHHCLNTLELELNSLCNLCKCLAWSQTRNTGLRHHQHTCCEYTCANETK